MASPRKQAPSDPAGHSGRAFAARVRAASASGPAATREAAARLAESPKSYAGLSIHEFAERCGVGAATVTRLTRAMGYAGYRHMQLDLSASLASEAAGDTSAFRQDDSPAALVSRVFASHRQSLADTEELLDTTTLVRVAKQVLKARQTVFAGFGESGTIATVAAQRLTSLGLTSRAATDPYDMIFLSNALTPKDVMVGISHTGRTGAVCEAVAAAGQRKVSTAAITNYADSPLADSAKWLLLTSFHEPRISAAVSSSRIAQSCIVDSLYFLIGGWRQQQSMELEEQAEQRVERLIRSRKTRRQK